MWIAAVSRRNTGAGGGQHREPSRSREQSRCPDRRSNRCRERECLAARGHGGPSCIKKIGAGAGGGRRKAEEARGGGRSCLVAVVKRETNGGQNSLRGGAEVWHYGRALVGRATSISCAGDSVWV